MPEMTTYNVSFILPSAVVIVTVGCETGTDEEVIAEAAAELAYLDSGLDVGDAMAEVEEAFCA